MMKRKLKPLVILVIVCFVTLSTFTITSAAGTKKWLEAWYGLSNTTYNGTNVTALLQPFAANDTTYIPLRKVCDLFGKDIVWNNTTKTVIITDKPGESIVDLKTQLAIKDADIVKLKKQVEDLQDELDGNNIKDIDDLEDKLNDDYDEYQDIDFTISLSGDEDAVNVKIEVDMNVFSVDWDNLSTSKRTSYLQDICDDILDVYEDADITGYIKNKTSTSKLLSFYTSSSGKVKLGIDGELNDLEDTLYDEFVSDYDDIDLSLELEGDYEDLTYTLKVNLDKYDSEYYDYLDNDDMRKLMRDIRNYIVDLDDFQDTEVEGYIYDTDNEENIARYYMTTTGSVFDTDL